LCEHVAAPAFLASCLESFEVRHIIPRDSLYPLEKDSRYNAAIGTVGADRFGARPNPCPKLQKWLTEPLDQALDIAVLAALPPTSRARLTASTSPFASIWLTPAVPLRHQQFRTLVRRRFSADVLQSRPCECGAVADARGDHALACPKAKGARSKLHFNTCAAITMVASQALLAPKREYNIGTGANRIDIALVGEHTTLLDFGATSDKPEVYATAKVKKYEGMIPPDHTFVPLVISTEFVWFTPAVPVLKKICGRYSDRFDLGPAGSLAAVGKIMKPIFAGVADIINASAVTELEDAQPEVQEPLE